MYEDEPQDRVHDVLAEAVFGDHPLGRRVLGEAEVIASIPVPDIEAYHQRPLHRRRTIVVGAAGHLDHERDRRARRAAGRTRRRDGERRRAGDGARRRRPALLLREGHRAVPHLLRRARASPATTSAATRSPCSTRSSAARPPRASSARCARSAASPTRSAPTTSSTPTQGLVATYVGTREDNVEEACAIIGAELGAAAHRAGLRRGAGPGEGERQGPPRPLLGVDRGADDADLPRDPVRPADRQPRRDAGQGRRGQGRRPDRAGGRALRRRAALGRLRRRATRTASARRWRRSARRW